MFTLAKVHDSYIIYLLYDFKNHGASHLVELNKFQDSSYWHQFGQTWFPQIVNKNLYHVHITTS